MTFLTTNQTTTQTVGTNGNLTVLQGVYVAPATGSGIQNAASAVNANIAVFGQVYGTYGLELTNTTTAYGGHSLYVGPTGILYGDSNAIRAEGTTLKFLNDGTIASSGNTVQIEGAASIINNGSIASTAVYGLYLSEIDGEASGYSITNTGTISSSAAGIHVRNTDALIINSGTIMGDGRGIELAHLTENTASISMHVVNSGTISGDTAAVRGHLFQLAYNETQSMILENSGTVQAADYAFLVEFGSATLINSGTMTGDIELGETSAVLNNTGLITGDISYLDGIDLDAQNTGQIQGSVGLSPATGSVFFENAGIITGDVVLPDGIGSFSGRSGTVLGDITGGANADFVASGLGDDLVFGNGGDDTLHGNEGNDTLQGGEANDLLKGGDGTDDVSGDAGDDVLYGNAGADSLNGGLDNDMLMGGDGDDILIGDAGFDTLYGNGGDDVLDGGGRADLLVGGKGDDTMTGGGSNDTFVIRRVGNGDDEVTDFQNGSDVVDLSALGVQNFNWLANIYNALSQDEDSVIIDLAAAGGSGSIRLMGVTTADMDASDFIF